MKKQVQYKRDPAVSARIPPSILEVMDQLVAEKKYSTRSELVRFAVIADAAQVKRSIRDNIMSMMAAGETVGEVARALKLELMVVAEIIIQENTSRRIEIPRTDPDEMETDGR